MSEPWMISAGNDEFLIHQPSNEIGIIKVVARAHNLHDASLIVTAVNAHAELLDAAKAILLETDNVLTVTTCGALADAIRKAEESES